MNKCEFLSYISILYLQRLEFTLSPFERIVFFRLFLTFGYKRFRKKDIKQIALKIDIHHLKLEEAFSELLKKFILVADGHDHIGVNRGYLKQLNQQRKIKSRIQSIRKHPKRDFLLQLFEKLFQIKISHKQKKSQQLLAMDYKQWLVLVNLVFLSDRDGVVLGAGTHELTNFTGLSRFALLRCMTYLFQKGILRSKIDGTLNNVYLNFVSSIYFINLSHPIWGEKRAFGRFIIFNPPEQTPIFKQFIEALNGWNPDEPLGDFNIKEFLLDTDDKLNSTGNGFVLQYDESTIPHTLETGLQWNKVFNQEFQLSRGYVKEQKKLSLNTNEHNFNRLDYVFCYLASYYSHRGLITSRLQSQLLPDNVKSMLSKLFREVVISKQLEHKANTLGLKLTDIMIAQNLLKQKILSLLVHYVYRDELSHVIDALTELTGQNVCNRVVPIGGVGKEKFRKIYFSPDLHLKHNELFLIQYTEVNIITPRIPIPLVSKVLKAYKRSIQKIAMDIKKQIELGLLNEQCLELDDLSGIFQ
ncbi:hypothetical protein [Acinetobacter johnsonii]|uniref:hypothetical protein n=1 Tax=Acinetobacter johnsonii TaxID=40214 RepID=UPI001F3E07C8|nr:hypothetical protein [Acinetobacter johnsonii]UJA00516.1 hypothetical protein GBN93_05930 [Acinetobacter johnsonii]